MPQQTQFFPLVGGLDLISPAITTPPGRVISGVNYEPIERGYGRVPGYERLDGQTAPSDASYWFLGFTDGNTAISEDDVVTGATSGAAGKALVAATADSGLFAGGDAAGTLVLTAVSGAFQDNENLEVGGSTVAVTDGTEIERAATTDELGDTYLQDAIETARALIQPVPGGGPVRGVAVYDGDVYAFRDDAASGATEKRMYKATSSGWAQQTFGRVIAFDAGTSEFFEGETLTGGTSSATATIKRIGRYGTGTFSSNDAKGALTLSGVSGTFQDDETITSASGSATADGVDEAIALSPGGGMEAYNHNFYGAANRRRMYFVDGVSKAHEWDGDVLAPITTGMAVDKPFHIAEHRNHLFLGYAGGSLQHSEPGNPLAWQVLTGAAEISLGDDITGLLSNVAGALSVFGRNQVAVLQGDDAANWVLRKLADDAGAIEGSVQMIGTPVYLDDRGLRSLQTTERFGDFLLGTLTRAIEPLLRRNKESGRKVAASYRVRSKDQYRLLWDDGTGFILYFGREQPEVLTVDLGFTPTTAFSGERLDGNEVLLVGAENGYVYEMDRGTSFDGEAVLAFLRFPFNNIGSPTQRTRFHKATFEIDARSDIKLALTAEFSYAASGQPPVNEQQFTVRGGGGFWTEDEWGRFQWSAPVEGLAEAHISGIGTNMSMIVVSESAHEQPHTLHGLILHITPRGLKR